MKKLVAISALLAVLLQTFSQVVILAEFYAKRDYIAKNLCENKSRPQMHCNGKCCLKKKLAKQGKEQAPSPRSQKSEQVILFYADLRLEVAHPFFTSPTHSYHSYNDLQRCSFHRAVFHPPAA